MRRFDNTSLWEIIKTSGNHSNIVSTRSYAIIDEFISELYTYSRSEKDIAERTRTLSYAKSELTAYIEESKKGTTARMVIKRAVYFIDSELDLVKMELEHPERFITFPDNDAPLARWNGSIAELLEYVIPVQIAGRVSKSSGEPMTYVDFVKTVERIFGITVNKPYDSKTKLLLRKKNATPFIDKMRQLLRDEAEKLLQ